MDWSVFTAICTGVTIIGGVFAYIVSKVFKFGELSANISNLSKKIDNLENKVEKVNDTVIANNDDLNTIKAVLNMKYKNLETTLTARHSPRVLNELGNKLFNDMHGKEFLEQNKDALFARIDKETPKAALDVEQAAQIACLSMVNQDFFIPIKTFVYNCPLQNLPHSNEKLDVDIETACYVLAIKLRDFYLGEHKDIPTS